MSTIGTFTRDGEGFTGTIQTMTIKTKTTFKPITKSGEQAPDFRIFSGDVEIGAAWAMTSKADKPYLSVKLDDPSFSAPINCRLVESGDKHLLLWNR